MVTVHFSRQEMVNMVRRAGLREAASEACGTCSTRLTSIKSRRGGTARHHQKRSHQPHGRQPMTRSAEAGPILQRYIRIASATRPYFRASKDSPVGDFIAEADRHPVFELIPLSEGRSDA